MTIAPTLEYRLDGFDVLRAGGIVQRQAVPRGPNRVWHLLWFLAAALLVILLAAAFGHDTPLATGAGIALIPVALALAAVNRRARAVMNGLFGVAPLLAGPSRPTLTDRALVFDNPECRTEYRWSAITGVVPHDGGVLAMTGKLHDLPIPASALAERAAADAVIAEIRNRKGA